MIPLLLIGAAYLIGKTIERDKKFTKGGKVKLNPEQYKLVHTPAFQDWFGNSEITNADKEPLTVYHFTNKEFNIFDLSKARTSGFSNLGFWFGSDKDKTKFYGRKEKKCYLKIENGYYVNNWDEFEIHIDRYSKTFGNEANDFREYLILKGYDGVIIEDADIDGVGEQTIYIVFNPTQIKLADGTNKTFDGENPDIRYEVGGGLDNDKINNIESEDRISYTIDGVEVGNLSYIYDENGLSESLPNQSEFYIDYVFVKDEYRDRGIAQKLIKSALIEANKRNAKQITLKRDSGIGCNIGSAYDNYLKKLYSKFGFKDINDDDCAMVLFNNNLDIKYDNGGEVDKLIEQDIVELKMYDTTPEHAQVYGFEAKNPLYIELINVSEGNRQKGIGKKILKHIDNYAIENGNDVILGHITQHAEPSIEIIKSMLNKAGFNTIEGNNDFYKLVSNPDIMYGKGGGIKQNEEDIFKDIYNYKYNGFYSVFNESELQSIIDFLLGVMLRTNSGLGEGIGKKTLRNLFFKTPQSFRELYEVKPSSNLWRGDTIFPIKKNSKSDFYLQSYSNKSMASFFGSVIWSSTAIESYGGSFSTSKYNTTLKSTDDWFLKAANFYLLSKKNKEMYSELFTMQQFFSIFYVLNGKGLIGRKYKNWLNKKWLRGKGINFNEDEYKYGNDIEIGDDEGEVMFFDVIYNYPLLKSIEKKYS